MSKKIMAMKVACSIVRGTGKWNIILSLILVQVMAA